MKQQCIALQDGFNAVRNHLEALEQSKDSKSRYEKAIIDISDYFNRKEVMYSPSINKEYRDDLLIRLNDGRLSKKRYQLFSRLSFMLDSYYADKPFALKYSRGNRYKVQLDERSQGLVDEFASYLDDQMSALSIPGYICIARDFFFVLQDAGIKNLKNLTDEDVLSFIRNSHQSRPASMNNVCCAVRKILEFLATKGCLLTSELVTFKTAPTRRVIQPAITGEELRIVLETPDRTTVLGKRDYAVLLLASFTGLRAIDIANFSFSNYDPEKLTIYLVQHKTGTPVGLPIPQEVVDAVNDYIEHGRPEVDSDYIFLSTDRPYRKLADRSSVRDILLRQLMNSSIGYKPHTGHGFHIFRRTMGSWLLGASVSPEMISQVLGHRDTEVLKRYLPLTPDIMRDCALGFEWAPLRSEVFS